MSDLSLIDMQNTGNVERTRRSGFASWEIGCDGPVDRRMKGDSLPDREQVVDRDRSLVEHAHSFVAR